MGWVMAVQTRGLAGSEHATPLAGRNESSKLVAEVNYHLKWQGMSAERA